MQSIKDEFGIYREKIFDDMLRRERKRTERTQQPFALIMVELRQLAKIKPKKNIRIIAGTLAGCFREIDVQGWYKQNSIIGIICPEVSHKNVSALKLKVEKALATVLSPDLLGQLSVSYICFPESKASDTDGSSLSVYPEFKQNSVAKVATDVCRRSMDFGVALCMLLFMFPFFLIFAIVIKVDSPGPVFFRQKRVGLGGKQFTFFKFRSMYTNNDTSAHKKFVTDFINAKDDTPGNEPKPFKIVNDPRITPVGRFLRKTSLDELPQLINVLRGDMSLVGPRPCIPYEFDEYRIWHRRRVMEVKPGITGFWQVYGRSITSFESMVRMDIHYIKYRNLFLDIILLLKTPLSLFKGAY